MNNMWLGLILLLMEGSGQSVYRIFYKKYKDKEDFVENVKNILSDLNYDKLYEFVEKIQSDKNETNNKMNIISDKIDKHRSLKEKLETHKSVEEHRLDFSFDEQHYFDYSNFIDIFEKEDIGGILKNLFPYTFDKYINSDEYKDYKKWFISENVFVGDTEEGE